MKWTVLLVLYWILLYNKQLNVSLIDLVWENSIDVLLPGVTFGRTLCFCMCACDLSVQSCKIVD